MKMNYLHKNKRTNKVILLMMCCLCLTFEACQRKTSYIDVLSKVIINSDVICCLSDTAGNCVVPSHINSDIGRSDSTMQLCTEDPLYNNICGSLGLNKPRITIYGQQNLADKKIIKMRVEDLAHNHLYVLLFDDQWTLLDTVSTREPINGDQLGYENDASIEWHYYSNFYFIDGLEKKTKDCEVKIRDKQVDTIFTGYYKTKYQVVKNKIVVLSADTITKGCRY